MLYLVENSGGWIESPICQEDLRKGDKVIAEFGSNLFYTDEEQFELFAEFVRQQEGMPFCHYNAKQLKELHAMWRAMQ